MKWGGGVFKKKVGLKKGFVILISLFIKDGANQSHKSQFRVCVLLMVIEAETRSPYNEGTPLFSEKGECGL